MTVYVIGAGPSGMMAAISAADNGNSVVILEKNEKIGKKLYITGKGRCNVTNRSNFSEFTENIVTNKKFLFSALKSFDCENTIELIESAGIKLKTERGNRVFPESDKSSDILKAFDRLLRDRKVKVNLNEKVLSIEVSEGIAKRIVTDKGEYTDIGALVVATGGITYPSTGSDGDGYKWARSMGLKIVPPVPALTGIYLSSAIDVYGNNIPMSELPKLQGISLKNVSLSAKTSDKKIITQFGEMLFTDKGISGPIVLTASSYINRINEAIVLSLDLKPALSEDTLNARILRDFESNMNKALKNVLGGLLPSGLIPLVLLLSRLNGDKKPNSVTKEERLRLIKTLKEVKFNFKSLEPVERAVVTAGGVSVEGIEPSSMKVKGSQNIYFVGEVLDIDALTGGYNIQLALSTGYCAGKHIFTEE